VDQSVVKIKQEEDEDDYSDSTSFCCFPSMSDGDGDNEDADKSSDLDFALSPETDGDFRTVMTRSARKSTSWTSHKNDDSKYVSFY